MVKLKNRDRFLERGIDVPAYIWQERPFAFVPQDFALQSERLKEKVFPSEVQTESYERFIESPQDNNIYGVASSPSDQRAKYFAAFLVQNFIERTPPNISVRWENLYSNFNNQAMDVKTSLLVITGLTPNAMPVKLEKARDLLEKHHNIPRIVVIAGEDPITYFSTRLYSSVHNIYYWSSAIVKQKVEVV